MSKGLSPGTGVTEGKGVAEAAGVGVGVTTREGDEEGDEQPNMDTVNRMIVMVISNVYWRIKNKNPLL